MTNEEKTWKSELTLFSKSSVYGYLKKRRGEKMRSRITLLIDRALASEDERIRGVAQSIREEALFWSELIGILDTEEISMETGKDIVVKAFRDYEDPLKAETQVGLPPTGG